MGWFGHLLSVLTFILSVTFVTVLLRSRKSPASTIAWLAVILISPYFGIPLYLILGARKFNLSTRPKGPRRLDGPPQGDRVQQILRAAGAPAPSGYSELRFLTTGENSYKALMDGIERARSRIDLSTFILADDPTGRVILGALSTKARQGVQIRLLLDALGSVAWVRPKLDEFKRAGGRVEFFMPLIHLPLRGQSNLRNHRKIALFDGKMAWFGGMNIAREYLGPEADPDRWIDLSLKVEGPLVRDLQAVFERDWEFASGAPTGELEAYGEFAFSGEKSQRTAQVIGSGPDLPSDPIYEALLEACYASDSRIWIATPYFVPDESLAKALELAAKRGVDVRVCVPRRSNHLFADLSRGTYLRQLSDAGAKVFFCPKMMHGKMVLIDDRFCLVGSANFDVRSLLYNYEIGVLLTSEADVKQGEHWLMRLLEGSREVVPQASYFRDLAEGVGRILGPVI